MPVGGDGFRHQAGVVSVKVRSVRVGSVGEFSGATRQKSCKFVQEVVLTLLEAIWGEEVTDKVTEELAELLASSGAKADEAGGDPTLEAAVRLADRIAKGDSGAARELVATHSVQKQNKKYASAADRKKAKIEKHGSEQAWKKHQEDNYVSSSSLAVPGNTRKTIFTNNDASSTPWGSPPREHPKDHFK